MFSIEKTLEEIVRFIKKLFISAFAIFFASPLGFQARVDSGSILKPYLYLLLSLVLFIAFLQLNIHFITEPFQLILAHYLNFLNEKDIGTNVLYVVPLGMVLYLFIHLISKLLFRPGSYGSSFKSQCFYWMGTALIFYVIIQFIIVALLSLITPTEGIATRLNRAIALIRWGGFVLPFSLCMLSVLLFKKSINIKAWFKFLMIPFITLGSIIFCYRFLEFTIQYSDLKTKPQVYLLSTGRGNAFEFQVRCADSVCKTVQINSDIVIQNKGEAALFIQNGDYIFIKAFNNEKDDVEWRDDHQTSLRINKIDNDSTSAFVILKPGDSKILHCSSGLNSTEWHAFVKATKKIQNNEYKALFEYSTASAGDKSYSYDSVVTIFISPFQ